MNRVHKQWSLGAVALAGVVAALAVLVAGASANRAAPAVLAAPALIATVTPTPLACGQGLWYEQAPYPNPVARAAAVGLGDQIYTFGGQGSSSTAAYRYDPPTDTWSALAPLPAGRNEASAVTDGTYIYILNGDDFGTGSTTLYRYNPATNSYTSLAPAPRASSAQAAVYVNGQIYRIAGRDGNTVLSSVDIYTVATNTWIPLGTVTDYPLGVEGLAAVAVGGTVVAGGGAAPTGGVLKTYRYDPVGNSWDDAAVPDLPQARFGAASGVLNGRWILAGGSIAGGYQNTAVALDLTTLGGWTALPLMEDLRFWPAGASTSTSFYAIGGEPDSHGSTDVQRYTSGPCPTPPISPTPTPCLAGTWAVLTPYPTAVTAPAAAAQNGMIYTFGGTNVQYSEVADTYRYDPAQNTWQRQADLPQPLRNTAAVSDGTYIYVVNGLTNSNAQDTLYRYDPATNSYTPLAPAPLATYSHVLALLNGQIYRIAGNGPGGGDTGSVDVYTIASNTWAPAGTIAAAPLGGFGVMAVAANGSLYVAGGGFPPKAKAYRYDPASNSWYDGGIRDLPEGRRGAASAVLNGRWVLAGDVSNLTSVRALDLADPTGLWQTLPNLPLGRSGSGVTIGNAFYAVGGLSQAPTDLQRYIESPCSGTFTPTPPPPTATGTPSTTRTPPASPTLPGSTRTPTAGASPPSGTPTPSRTVTPPAPPASVTATATACALQFTDVSPGSTFYDFVHCLACRGIVGGYPCGGPGEPCPGPYFRPNNNVTRGQVAKIVAEAAGLTDPVPSTQQTFEDIGPGSTFWLWIERLAGRTIIGGYPCGGSFEPCIAPGNRPYFRPNNPVTRGQLSKIVSGAAGWIETPTGQTFQDVAPGSTFYLYVERIASRGIVGGYPCGGASEPCIPPTNRPYFRPNNSATRGQMSKIAALAFFPGCSTPTRR